MQKKQLSLLIIGSILAILIALFLFAFYFLHFECHRPQEEQNLSATGHVELIVDFDHSPIHSENSLAAGNNALLAVQTVSLNNNIEYFNSLSGLQSLDMNKDGRIDKNDPRFASLMLIYLNTQDQSRRYESLEKAGIVAIVFPNKLSELINSVDPLSNKTAGYALTQEGKKIDIVLAKFNNDSN